MKTLADFRSALATIKNQIKDFKYEEAFLALRNLADAHADFAVQHRFAKLFASLPTNTLANTLDLKPLKVAILSTSTIDQFLGPFSFYLATAGFSAKFLTPPINTLQQTVLDPESDLYAFKPDIIWLFTHYRDIPFSIAPGCSQQSVEEVVQKVCDSFTTLWRALKAHNSGFVIQNNADIPMERVFGNYESNVPWSRSCFLRRFNLALAEAVVLESGVNLFDLDHISSVFGKSHWQTESYWHHSKHAFSPNAIGPMAFQGSRLIQGIKGLAKKCLVLDLDNTLWGGIIGDDGVEGIRLGNGSAEGEAFLAFQTYLKALKERGIILTVCSKNQDENARIPFESHEEMCLHLEDFALFVANWNNKADNILHISKTLGIGLESMVFIDDNPVERDLVARLLPMVEVPQLPEDPALFVRTLDHLCLFETSSFLAEDKIRGEMYQHNAQRQQNRDQFFNLDDFLKDLHMGSSFGDINSNNLSRCAQLINKSNQFHLTTTRYLETELQKMVEDKKTLCRYYRLQDRFGDNGLVSVVILRHESDVMVVDTWVMSCRVFSRGLDAFIHNDLVAISKAHGCHSISGCYIPSKKNSLVEKLYASFGYEQTSTEGKTTHWRLSLSGEPLILNTPIRPLNNN